MTEERLAQGMRSMKRDMTEKRKWTRQNPYTTLLSARVPNHLAERLREYVEYTEDSVSDVIVSGIDMYLKKYSPLERAERTEERDE